MRLLPFLGVIGLALAGPAGAQTAPAGPATVATHVLARMIDKGERLSAADFQLEQRSPATARNALRPADAEGMEASRRLMAGSAVRATDLMRAQTVRRGEAVTIALVNGPISITTAGRALSGGGNGDTVRVISLSTNRTLDAVVERTGHVRVAGH